MIRHIPSWILFILIASCGVSAWAYEPEQEGSAPTSYPGNSEEGTRLEREAVQAFQEHQYVRAAQLFAEAWDAYQHPRYQFNIGQCYRHAQQWEPAVTAYRRRLELEPGPPVFIYSHLGACLLQAGQREQANEAFRRYLELAPNGDVAPQVRRALETGQWSEEEDQRPAAVIEAGRRVHEQAQQLCEQGQYQQAAEAYLEGYRQNNQVGELLLNAALCTLWAGQVEQAIERFEQYLQTPGADAAAHAFIAECRLTQGNLAAARDAYQRYLQQAPDGEYVQQARQVMQFLSGLDPLPTSANMLEAKQHVQRACDHAAASRYRRALREFEAAYQIIPAHSIRFNIGTCHRGLRQWAEGLECFEAYLENRGDEGENASVHLSAADCLIHLNRNEEAQRHIDAFRRRAEADELPNEQTNRAWAVELEQEAKDDE